VEAAPIAASLAVSDAEAQAYLKSHEAEFRQPERRRIQYVAFVPKDFTRPVTDGDLQKYYTEHAKEFETPAQARGAHILARVAETGGSEAEDKARSKIAEAIRRVRGGEDFGKLARELSEDTGSAKNGGELGWVSKGETAPAFEQALFALRKGELSVAPVRTPFGFHAIKLEDKREGGRKPLKEVAGPLRTRLASEAADRAAKARADEVRATLQGAADFVAEARRLGVAAVETTIARRDAMPGMAPRDPLEETAFALASGGVSAPVKTPAGWLVLKQVRALPAAVPPLEEIRDRVQAAVKREKAEAIALERARRIAADARQEDLLAAARKAGAATGQTPRFSRAKPAERLPGDALNAALEAPAGALTEPVKTQQGYYVLKVLERVPPATTGLATERDKLAGELLARKQSQVWQSWLATARAGAKIEATGRVPGPRG
jgi:peptidyl-prolyl cis-trans isomerase D